jgi:hypothetical protein
MLQRLAFRAVSTRTVRTGAADLGDAEESLVEGCSGVRHRSIFISRREGERRRRVVVLDGDGDGLAGQGVPTPAIVLLDHSRN